MLRLLKLYSRVNNNDDFLEAVVTPKVERCEHILETLADCEKRNSLTSGQAKETFGKLS